ncbi:MAG: SPOR domain-containing protein [Candidatus Puniceispirillales bacterium]
MRIILMLFGGVAVLIIAGIGYIMFMSPQQMDEIAIITADERPYKIVPVNPGGADIKNTDSTFLNSLDSGGQIPEGGEQLLPEEPVPELPPIDVSADLADQEIESETDIVINNQTIATNEADTVTDLETISETSTVNIDPETTDITENDNLATQDASDDNTALANAENNLAAVSSSPEQISETPETAETAETAVDPVDIDLASSSVPIPKAGKNLNRPDESLSAFYRVQLAAFKDEGKAMQVAAILMNKHISRLDQVSIGVMLHDAGEQGMFWRVVTDPMPRANASKLCNTLKSVGQDCILRSWN